MTRRFQQRVAFACLAIAALAATALPALADDGGACIGKPYEQRPFADADLIKAPTNFLRCESGTYALCYYSGAEPMPCTLDGDIANCQCQVFTASPDEPMYIDINSILDKCAYEEAVEECGANGELCRNLCTNPIQYSQASDPSDREQLITAGIANACTTAEIAEISDPPQATVCSYVATGTFNESAELVSTFSFSVVYPQGGSEPFHLGSTTETGAYAGCMTAPCSGNTTTSGNEYTTCACPVFGQNGPGPTYQFGRKCSKIPTTDPTSPEYCKLEAGSEVWSAASSQLYFPSGGGSDQQP